MALQTHFAALVRWRQDQEYYWNNMHTIKVIHRENIDHCQTKLIITVTMHICRNADGMYNNLPYLRKFKESDNAVN